MITNKIIKVVLLLFGVAFVLLQSFALEIEGAAVGTLMLVLLTFLYYRYTDNKNNYFLWFLIAFSLAQLLSYIAYYGPELEKQQTDYFYYVANSLYIISYMLLLIKVLVKLDLKTVFLEFPISIIILIVLDVFSVSIVSSTTENVLTGYQYTLEYTYNAVIMTLLSVALINYMYRNDNKSMLFLIGCICILFSEILQLAYYYILESNDLGFIYSLFLVAALIFFYLQSQIAYTGPVPEYTDEQLEV